MRDTRSWSVITRGETGNETEEPERDGHQQDVHQ
jgi:hypothetical protein